MKTVKKGGSIIPPEVLDTKDSMKIKLCKGCLLEKDTKSFYKNRARYDGLQTYCMECNKEEKKVHPASKEVRRLQNARYRRSKKGCSTIKKLFVKWRLSSTNRLIQSMRCLIGYSIRSRNGQRRKNTEPILGYSYESLISHLESQFKEGMTWENYGKWHVDHKIPVSFFQFNSTDDVEFKMCWRLENLQPLWAKENQSKGNRLCPTG